MKNIYERVFLYKVTGVQYAAILKHISFMIILKTLYILSRKTRKKIVSSILNYTFINNCFCLFLR